MIGQCRSAESWAICSSAYTAPIRTSSFSSPRCPKYSTARVKRSASWPLRCSSSNARFWRLVSRKLRAATTAPAATAKPPSTPASVVRSALISSRRLAGSVMPEVSIRRGGTTTTAQRMKRTEPTPARASSGCLSQRSTANGIMHPKPGDRRPPEDDPQPRIPGALRELDELQERVRRENPELAAALKAASDELPDYSDPGAV